MTNANRLVDETSPYLLQHAHNPVDWYPWGEEALARAVAEDKPIFLSIGYSACHWCHVMERESFENPEIAARMNRDFVNVKVDREERPDLDRVYMASVVALTGHGGWPMSVFLTPDLRPFHGGTYWPPTPQRGMPGFPQVLEAVSTAWTDRRDDIDRGAEQLSAAVVAHCTPPEPTPSLAVDQLENAHATLLKAADRTFGGFGRAPKFPHAMDVRLLLRCAQRFDSPEALDVARLALDRMAGGGLYDHLGGGFHRYSTDARWLVPHFEKMLYDNALLVPGYLEAYRITGEESYRRVVVETLDYVLRELTQSAGGFFSTQDADSEGVEGKFFVWSPAEIEEHLPAEDARVFASAYDVTAGGNWEGHSILNRPATDADTAARLGITIEELRSVLARSRETLFAVRSRRIAPGRDDKVLASWNGLMIAAMAKAGAVLNDERYVAAARSAADFVLTRMRDESGRLLHAFKDERARFNGYLDDHACLIDGLVELYQADFDARHLTAAAELADAMIERFADAEQGGFFDTSVDHERLITRTKDGQDNATPSGNAMAATALLKLARLTGDGDREEVALRTLEAFSGQMSKVVMASGQWLIALDAFLGPALEVVIVDGDDRSEGDALLAAFRERFVPGAVVLRVGPTTDESSPPAVLQPLLAGKTARDGRATAYVCERGACREPVTDVAALRRQLDAY